MLEALIVKKEQSLEAFRENVTSSVVCDKCLQPIDAAHSSQSLMQLKTDLATTFDEREHILEVREIVKPPCVCMQPEC
jgi:hypothetical protein